MNFQGLLRDALSLLTPLALTPSPRAELFELLPRRLGVPRKFLAATAASSRERTRIVAGCF